MKYYAKSENKNGVKQTCKSHIGRVKELCAEFSKDCNIDINEANIVAAYHDFGKYTQSFQDVLAGKRTGVDHAFAGAAIIYKKSNNGSGGYMPVVEAVNAHHEGIAARAVLLNCIEDNFRNSDNEFVVSCNESNRKSAVSNVREYLTALQAFSTDFPTEAKLKKIPSLITNNNQLAEMLHTRMLLSCLVDADYTASSENDGESLYEKKTIEVDNSIKKLEHIVAELRKKSTSNKNVNDVRDELFENCKSASLCKNNHLFTVTAPTGAGKTVSLLEFALQRCKLFNRSRIITVLPYLAISDQTEEIYKNIIDGYTVDHSQSKLNEKTQRSFIQSWNAPCIITTSVKFFESLFSNHPGNCRKLHNIANSVVIFDEAQSMPMHVMQSTLLSITELCNKYNVDIVLSTATQPDFTAIKDVKWEPTEVVKNPQFMFDRMKRTDVEWKLNNRSQTSFLDIAIEMAQENNVCAIVNTKKQAKELYGLLKALVDNDKLFYITTDLCPEHRRKIISELKNRQQNARKGIVAVATQCIEAGVDLDFDTVYRVLAPLDAIIQAAGRCNRNGNIDCGKVVVFYPALSNNTNTKYGIYPDGVYESGANSVFEMFLNNGIDINNVESIKEYYQKYFRYQSDSEKLVSSIKSYNYPKVDEFYQYIKNSGVQIIVPYNSKLSLYEKIYDEIEKYGGIISKQRLREAASIMVSSYLKETDLNRICEKVFLVKRGVPIDTGIMIVRHGYESVYKSDIGLDIESCLKEKTILAF